MKKIYIIGPVGSGKTTFARKLSKKYNIEMYELDKVVWDDDRGNIKRSDEEISKLFKDILHKKSWIIEDVGRDKFLDGIKCADVVYYLNMNKIFIYKRCITRWIKQIIRVESYNYKPTIKSLFVMFGWINKDFKNKQDKINYIMNHSNKYIILSWKDIKKFN